MRLVVNESLQSFRFEAPSDFAVSSRAEDAAEEMEGHLFLARQGMWP